MRFLFRICVAGTVVSLVAVLVLIWLQMQTPPPIEVSQWALVGAIAAIPVSVLAAVSTHRSVCPQCSAFAGVTFRGDLLGSRPLHQRVDGRADRRYKYNPDVETYEWKARCGKCKHEWRRWI
jgi:hypothetical protein